MPACTRNPAAFLPQSEAQMRPVRLAHYAIMLLLRYLWKKVCRLRNQPHRDQGTVGDSQHWRVRILPLEAVLGTRDCILVVGKACDERKLLSRCQDLQPCDIIIWQALNIHDCNCHASSQQSCLQPCCGPCDGLRRSQTSGRA